VWLSEGLELQPFPSSAYTYTGHKAAVTDVCVIENSHTVVSGAADGSVHVWRVLLQSRSEKAKQDAGHKMRRNSLNSDGSSSATPGGDGSGVDGTGVGEVSSCAGITVLGSSLVKKIDEGEGGIVSVQHYHTDVASVVVYITSAGYVVGWDLRSQMESFRHRIRPELGTPSCFAFGPNRDCVLVGTHKGYLALWDLRAHLLVKLWRHSSHCAVNRLLTCRSLPAGSDRAAQQRAGGLSSVHGTNKGPAGFYVFVAAGNGETGMWAMPETSSCLRCFRAITVDRAHSAQANLELPSLEKVALPDHIGAAIADALSSVPAARVPVPQASQRGFSEVKALVGFVSMSSYGPDASAYLITAGSDAHIRYWDMNSVGGCRTVCGPAPNQPRPCYFTPTREAPTAIVDHGALTRHARGGFEAAVTSVDANDAVRVLGVGGDGGGDMGYGPNGGSSGTTSMRVGFSGDGDPDSDDEASIDAAGTKRRSQGHRSSGLSRYDSSTSVGPSDASAMQGHLYLCHDFAADPYFQDLSSCAIMPAKHARGAVAVQATCLDSVLDVKILDLPLSRDSILPVAPRLLVSASRDGTIGLWK